MIDAKIVKELREITGAGMMDCKKALVKVNGDIDKAVDYLKEKGIAKATKKSSRIAAEGLVEIYVSEDNKVASAIEVNAETDFVAKNDEFKAFVKELAKIVAKTNPRDLEDLKTKEYENGVTVLETLTNKIATIGENMNIRRFERIETEGIVRGYLHGNGKIAVLVEIEGGNIDVADDICMQVAALNPEFLDETQIPEDRVNHEKEILKQLTMNDKANASKPEAVIEKITEGRLNKFFEEICLVHQAFVKESSKKVKDVLKENNAKIVKYVRFEKGEGLEKRVENFAEEVMGQLK
ncbi:MAG: translation elongation factor Ts [Clostridium sp.]